MISLSLKLFLKEKYPRRWSFLLDVASIFFSLMVLWMTGKAFRPIVSLKGEVSSYYSYLLVAEMGLLCPLSLVHDFTLLAKRFSLNGIAELVIVQSGSFYKVFFRALQGNFIYSIFKTMLFYFLSGIFFEFPFPVFYLPIFLCVMFLMCFLTSIISMNLVYIILFWGRGQGLFNQFVSLMSIFAGSYFPLDIFDSRIKEALLLLNPLAFYLDILRHVVKEGISQISLEVGLVYSIWIFMCVMTGISLKTIGLKKIRKNGSPIQIYL